MTKASDNAFPSLLITEGTEPSAPAAGKQRVYIDSTTHKLMRTNSSGTEVSIEGATFGTWTNYTPTLTATTTNPTLGSTVVSGRYLLIDSKNGLVAIKTAITTGGAWNAGSGEYKWSLPSGWTAGAFDYVGSVHILDSGTARFAAVCLVTSGDTKISATAVGDASGARAIANNVPVTWATGDTINIQIRLELA